MPHSTLCTSDSKHAKPPLQGWNPWRAQVQWRAQVSPWWAESTGRSPPGSWSSCPWPGGPVWWLGPTTRRQMVFDAVVESPCRGCLGGAGAHLLVLGLAPPGPTAPPAASAPSSAPPAAACSEPSAKASPTTGVVRHLLVKQECTGYKHASLTSGQTHTLSDTLRHTSFLTTRDRPPCLTPRRNIHSFSSYISFIALLLSQIRGDLWNSVWGAKYWWLIRAPHRRMSKIRSDFLRRESSQLTWSV